MDRWGDYWRFTNLSLEKLFRKYFMEKNIQVETYGNVKTAVALLHGLAAEELGRKDLDYCDKDYQLLIGVKAMRDL